MADRTCTCGKTTAAPCSCTDPWPVATGAGIPGYRIIGPLAYVGKLGCENPTCTHIMLGKREDGSVIFDGRCRGYHCSYCDAACSSQGHRCDAAMAILGEAERIAAEEA